MAKSWDVKSLYFYLVCLVTLFLIVGGAIGAVNSAMQIALPDQPNVPLIHVYYRDYRGELAQPVFDPPPLAELEKMRAEMEERDQYFYFQSWALQRLLNSIALFLIPIPFYLYHWKKIKPAAGGVRNEA